MKAADIPEATALINQLRDAKYLRGALAFRDPDNPEDGELYSVGRPITLHLHGLASLETEAKVTISEAGVALLVAFLDDCMTKAAERLEAIGVEGINPEPPNLHARAS